MLLKFLNENLQLRFERQNNKASRRTSLWDCGVIKNLIGHKNGMTIKIFQKYEHMKVNNFLFVKRCH